MGQATEKSKKVKEGLCYLREEAQLIISTRKLEKDMKEKEIE